MDESIYKIVCGVMAVILWFAIRRLLTKLDNFEKRFDGQDAKLDSIITKQNKQDNQLTIHAYILKRLDPSFIVHYPD